MSAFVTKTLKLINNCHHILKFATSSIDYLVVNDLLLARQNIFVALLIYYFTSCQLGKGGKMKYFKG